MERTQIAPGAFLTNVPGEKFKRCKILVNLVVQSTRENATALALLPHILGRRCEAVPDATALSRRLFSLYGAELSAEGYTAGASRVVALGISGLKSAFALAGEDLEGEYLDLLLNLLFAPKLSGGVFETQDVAIEKEKQAEFLRSEMNNKRVYCLRQARRKLYGASPLGIESSGYLEDINALAPGQLYAGYTKLLSEAQVEVYVCGANAAAVAAGVEKRLSAVRRTPAAPVPAPALPVAGGMAHFEEAMDTAQGKLCLMFTSGRGVTPRADAVMRLASALLGGLPTSRLFMNVREKQSLCYYCASSSSPYAGTLTVDSGVDHKNAGRAAKAILHEVAAMQQKPVSEAELADARRYLRSSYAAAKDSPDALVALALNEWLLGTHRTLDEMVGLFEEISAAEVQAALAAFTPALEYVITAKGGAQ